MIDRILNELDIITNPDHPNCYICNNGLCHLDISMREIKEDKTHAFNS